MDLTTSEKQLRQLRQLRQLKQLKNIGPKLAARMIEVGIDTPEKLRGMGARKAFAAMYKDGDSYGDFNAAYLYALEGAIRNCDWSDVPSSVKDDFRAYANSLQDKKEFHKHTVNQRNV